jgi:hypothetical protein
MADNFKLPKNGYDVVTKILHGYAACGSGKAKLNDVAKKAGLNATMVSANNGFLVSIGALGEGRDKELSAPGKALAIAIGNNIEEEVRAEWRSLFLACDDTRSIVDMIKIQRGIPKSHLVGRIASSLGLVSGNKSKTGINTLIEILETAHLIRDDDGKYVIHEDASKKAAEATNAEASDDPPETDDPPPKKKAKVHLPGVSVGNPPDIHINIQVHISPESTPEQIEKIFESMAKYLKPGS